MPPWIGGIFFCALKNKQYGIVTDWEFSMQIVELKDLSNPDYVADLISQGWVTACKSELLPPSQVYVIDILGELPRKLHSEDGPAVWGLEPHNTWWMYIVKDRTHRIDGPAEHSNGVDSYYVDDIFLSKEIFDLLITEVSQLSPELKLIDPRWWVRELK
jgi:hypothetical protein